MRGRVENPLHKNFLSLDFQRYLDESVSELVKYLCGIVSRYQSISVSAPESLSWKRKEAEVNDDAVGSNPFNKQKKTSPA